jgi:hypothetical protein
MARPTTSLTDKFWLLKQAGNYQASLGFNRRWLGKEWLTPDPFAAWGNGRLSPTLSPTQFDRLRARFTPEVLVPADFTVRQPIERYTEAGLGAYLLDYDQEQALKIDLNLSQAGQNAAQDFQLRLITAVPPPANTP